MCARRTASCARVKTHARHFTADSFSHCARQFGVLKKTELRTDDLKDFLYRLPPMSQETVRNPISRTPPIAARVWGWLGVAPFAALALSGSVFEAFGNFDYRAAFISYGAIILSFMGGIQWGIAMASKTNDDHHAFRFTISIVPVLFALCAMVIPLALAHIVLAAGFLLLLLYDIYVVKKFSALGWYPKLRIPLTTAVLACIAINALSF